MSGVLENAVKMTKSGRITGRRDRVVPRVRRAIGSQMSGNATYASFMRTCCVVQLFVLRTPSTRAKERLQTQKSAGPLRWLPPAEPRTKYTRFFGKNKFFSKKGARERSRNRKTRQSEDTVGPKSTILVSSRSEFIFGQVAYMVFRFCSGPATQIRETSFPAPPCSDPTRTLLGPCSDPLLGPPARTPCSESLLE